MTPEFLEHWLEELLSTPGLTSIGDIARARRALVDDALRATAFVRDTQGPIVDVGSGGGSPGIPLAVALPERRFVLLESQRRKCDFLERVTAGLAHVDVLWGRAEEQAPDEYGAAVAKALARPPVAAELCLPLVRAGGSVVLWIGEKADAPHVARVAGQVGGRLEKEADGLLLLRKIAPTPAGFPRRPGMAKKRPIE